MWVTVAIHSVVKHQLFRLSATTDELTLEGIDAPLYLFYSTGLKPDAGQSFYLDKQ